MRRIIPLLVLMLVVPLAACAAQTAGSSSPLAGSEWRFTAIDGEAPVSDRAKLAFDGERLSASVGCNTMNGNWRIEDGRLIAGPLMQTRMACPGRLGEQEDALAALLVAAPEAVWSGQKLELRSGGHHAELVRAHD